MAGPMMIDLGKRAGKRALHAAESALSWQGWNSANPLHPKGPDGRWVKGHPFTRIIGDAPDHIHHLSDEDLASVDQSAESLLRAITAEKGRRGIGRIAQERSAADIPASRTYGTRPKEDFSVAGGSEEALATAYSRTRGLRERLANARTREEGHALLSDLEKKDLLQVAREMNIPGASALSKDNLRREMVEGSVGRRLDMIATRGFEGPLPGTGMTNSRARPVIGHWVGKDPNDPWQHAPLIQSLESAGWERVRTHLRPGGAGARGQEYRGPHGETLHVLHDRELFGDLKEEDELTQEGVFSVLRESAARGTSGKARRINELTEKIRIAQKDLDDSWGDSTIASKRAELNHLKAQRAALGAEVMSVPNPAKPLRAARKPKMDIDSVRANWEAAVNGPMPSDRERFRTELSGLTIKQLEELNGEKLPAGAKAQKINHMIEHRLGFRLNSETIRSTPLSRAETLEQVRIRQEMHAADLAGDRETYRRLHLERLNLRDEEPPAARDEGLSRRFQLETRRDELQASLREQYGTNANGWPYDSRREELDRIWDELEAIQGGKRAQAPAFDITDAGHRQARINELTAKINAEPDAGKRTTLRKERAELATWKEPGSKRRPREPFRYEGENPERARERHGAALEAQRPAMERDRARAEELRGRIWGISSEERILEILREEKLNARQLSLLADELNVNFSGHNQFDRAVVGKAARERYLAAEVAGHARRNPSRRILR